MKNSKMLTRGTIAAVLMAIAGARAGAQTTMPALALGVGDKAPEISVVNWAKGTEIKSFEPGKIYVVEFWATWCVPCKMAIPHLTELAKKYDGKVSFIGVDVLEHTKENTDQSIIDHATAFVKSMGAKMDYNVAIDGANGFMANHWLDAGEQQGIPATFVINDKGQVAWIGHPDLLPPVLEKLTAGQWDMTAERARNDAERAENGPMRYAFSNIYKAMAKRDYPSMLLACENAEKMKPELESNEQIIGYKLQALMHLDAGKAVSYVKTLSAPGGYVAKSPGMVREVLVSVPENLNKTVLSVEDWKTITTAIDPVFAKAKPTGDNLANYSKLMELTGDHEKSLKAMRTAVELTSVDTAKHVGVGDMHEEYYVNNLKKRKEELAALESKTGPAAQAN